VPSARRLAKGLVRRLLRPALTPLEDAIAGAGAWHAWRGGLDGCLVGAVGDAHLERRLRDELAFWDRVVRRPGSHPAIDGPFHDVFARWQRERAGELANWLELDDNRFDAWRAGVGVVEVGAGPHPFVAHGRWRWAVSVDPLNDGYAACGLLPEGPLGYVPICAPGERLPLPSAHAGLVVCDNCLDHVADPGRVVAEIARVLVDGGLAWVLVDLRDDADDMHPHPFTADRLGAMLRGHGLETIRRRVSEHRSNPDAWGEARVLARRLDRG